jgi:negative regulator of sigma E activity
MSAMHRTDRPGLADADLEQLSAWLDGELEPEQHRAMLDRLKNEPSLRAQFEWFNLAGDALRSHEVAACHHPALVVQVREALRLEPVRVAPGALAGSKVRRHLAAAVTVAAAVGMLVIVVPQLRGPDAEQRQIATSTPPPQKAQQTPQLEAYFRAHRELADTGVMPSAVAYIRNGGEPDR